MGADDKVRSLAAAVARSGSAAQGDTEGVKTGAWVCCQSKSVKLGRTYGLVTV